MAVESNGFRSGLCHRFCFLLELEGLLFITTKSDSCPFVFSLFLLVIMMILLHSIYTKTCGPQNVHKKPLFPAAVSIVGQVNCDGCSDSSVLPVGCLV